MEGITYGLLPVKKFLSHPLLRKHLSQGLRFALCGVVGSSIDLATLTLLVEFFKMNPNISFALSSLFAVIFVFLANKYFTFQNHEGRCAHQAFKFAMVYGTAIIFNITISSLFLRVGFYYVLSKIIAIGVVAVWNYSLSHGFVFRTKENMDAVVF